MIARVGGIVSPYVVLLVMLLFFLLTYYLLFNVDLCHYFRLYTVQLLGFHSNKFTFI